MIPGDVAAADGAREIVEHASSEQPIDGTGFEVVLQVEDPVDVQLGQLHFHRLCAEIDPGLRAVVVPRFLVAGHTVVLEVVQDILVDVGKIQHEGRPVPLGEFPVRPLDEQVARPISIMGWYLPM